MGVKTNMYFWDKEASETEKKISYYEGKEKEFIIEQLRKNGLNLQYIPINMKSDRDVVLAAVSNNGGALQFASDDLRDDREIVDVAISSVLPAIRFSDALRGNKSFVMSEAKCLDTFESNHLIGFSFRDLSEELRNDVEVAKIAIEYSGSNLKYAGAGIRYWCKDLVLSAVSSCKFGTLQYVHHHSPLRLDTDIITAAVAHDWTNIQFLSTKTSMEVKKILSKIALEQMDKSDPHYDDNLRFIDAFTTQKREGHLDVAKNAWVNPSTGLQTLYRRIEKEQEPPRPKGFKLSSSYTSIFHSVCVENIEKINHQSFSGPS